MLVVGRSGCGKSTLLKILMSLMPPQEGRLLWDDQPLQEHNFAEFRQSGASVLQQDRFFKGSIASNIAMGDAIDETRLRQTLSTVGLSEVMASLPLGLRTELGDIASGFSTGELQRLYLARALYKEPSHLFVDEGTANLDPLSAVVVQQLLAQLNCTRVVVSHDVSMALHADRVVQLQDGCLVELDSEKLAALQAELRAQGERYAA